MSAHRMRLLDQPWPLKAIWVVLLVEAGLALATGALIVAFVALTTFALTLAPIYLQRFIAVRIPAAFIVAVALFLMATLFLGEARDFYNRFWWWDSLLHFGSAIGFGLIGVVLMLILVRGDRLSAAPITATLFAFCFAVTIGALWEIFEFAVDLTLGTNMQKSGLVDTMKDLIVDCIGAALGAFAGYAHLRGWQSWLFTSTIRDFVTANDHLFPRRRKRRAKADADLAGPPSIPTPQPSRPPSS